jgi:hypothetical protein
MIEPIRPNTYDSADRMRVQREVMNAVQSQPEAFWQGYAASPIHYDGRYVCADSFKELFTQYAHSKETRNLYNGPVHNSAAVLAAAQFARVIADGSDPNRIDAVFITGIPGAGKTSAVLSSGRLPEHARVVYEGQLADPVASIQKIQAALDVGLHVKIIVVHTAPEQALENTFTRFNHFGRGASINVMAKIQGNLPDSLEIIRETFKDRMQGEGNDKGNDKGGDSGGRTISLKILDRSADFTNPVVLTGWDNINFLRKEGNHEHITERLARALEHARSAGRIGEDCYRQAAGQPPRELGRHLDRQRDQGVQKNGRGPELSR